MQSQVLSLKRSKYRSTAKNKKRAGITDKDTRLYYVACGIFLVGIALGALIVTMRDQTLIQYLNLLTKSGIESRSTARFLSSFVQCLLPNLIFILICLIGANCAVGLPIVITVLIFRGLSVGLLGGYFYLQTGAKGFLYSAILLVPPVLVIILSLIHYAIAACKSSIYIFSMVYRNVGRNMKTINADLLHRLFVAALASCAAAALESVLYIAFGSLFIA